MKKKVTVTKEYIDEIKRQRDDLRERLTETELDRDKFRAFFVSLLKANVKMASRNEHYGPESMITQLSKLMNDVKNWYWS